MSFARDSCLARGSGERSPTTDLLSEAMQMAGVPDVVSPLRSQSQGAGAAIANSAGPLNGEGLLAAILQNDERPLAPGVSFEMPALRPAGSEAGMSKATPSSEGRVLPPPSSKRPFSDAEYDSDFEDPAPTKRTCKSLSQKKSKPNAPKQVKKRTSSSGPEKKKGKTAKRVDGEKATGSCQKPLVPAVTEYRLRAIDMEKPTSSRPSLPRNCESGKGASMLRAMLANQDVTAASKRAGNSEVGEGRRPTAVLPATASASTSGRTEGMPIEVSSDSESEFDVLSQREDRELVKLLKRKRSQFERERQAALEQVRVGEASQVTFQQNLESVDADLRRSNAEVERLEELRRAKEERQRFQERRVHILEGKERERRTLERDRLTLAKAEKRVRLLD